MPCSISFLQGFRAWQREPHGMSALRQRQRRVLQDVEQPQCGRSSSSECRKSTPRDHVPSNRTRDKGSVRWFVPVTRAIDQVHIFVGLHDLHIQYLGNIQSLDRRQ